MEHILRLCQRCREPITKEEQDRIDRSGGRLDKGFYHQTCFEAVLAEQQEESRTEKASATLSGMEEYTVVAFGCRHCRKPLGVVRDWNASAVRALERMDMQEPFCSPECIAKRQAREDEARAIEQAASEKAKELRA